MGRPARLPEDRSAWAGARINTRARIGWLHLVSRSVAGVTRAELVDLLASQDLPADPNRMSRWESGRQHPEVAITRGYESALGLAPGRLLAPTRMVSRAGGAQPGGVAVQRLDALVSAALDPDAAVSGDAWLRLSLGLADHDHVYLREAEWERLTSRLLSELARTAGLAHHQRHEACLTLLHHPSSQRHVLRAIGAWVTTPDVQLVTPVLGLLAQVGGDTDDLLLRLLHGNDPRVAAATVPVAAAKVAAGHVARPHLPALADLAARGLAGDAAGRDLADLLDLASALPDDAFARVLDPQRDGARRDQLMTIRRSATLLPDAHHRRLARSLGWRTQWSVEEREPPDPDRLLERLIREALFHVDGRRRELAGRLVAASPYGSALATHVAAVVDDPRDLLATRAWELLLVLGHGDAFDLMVRRATDPEDPHRADALLAIALGSTPLDDDAASSLVRVAHEEPGLRYPAATVLGLAAPDRLARLVGLDDQTDRAVAWWRRVGARVED